MRTIALIVALSLASLACNARLAGHTLGLGGVSPTDRNGTLETEVPDDRVILSDAYDHDPEGRFEPYADGPADAWAGVDGDGPARISAEAASELGVRVKAFACTAVHDHCLLRRTWFIESHDDRRRNPGRRHAVPAVFGPDEPGPPWNVQASHPAVTDYTALRTVPATRALLTAGATVVVLTPGVRHPSSGGEAYNRVWDLGVVDRVDWKGGALYLAGRDGRYWISAARVAVLSWRPGEDVAAVGGLTRAQMKVGKGDVIAPAVAPPSVAEPWAEVDADGQPRVAGAGEPIAETETTPCDAAHDHCLRPWLWFVDVDGAAVPARYTRKGFVRAARPDASLEVGYAYRTAPATAASVRAGATVVVFAGHSAGPSTEHEAMDRAWRLAKVARVLPDGLAVELEGGDRASLALVRVPALRWFAGDRAEALP